MALGNHDKRAHAVGVAITQISLSDTVCVLPSKADHLSSPLFLYVLVNNMEPVISASYFHTHFSNLCRSSAVERVCASKSSSNSTSSTCEPDLSQSYLSTTMASPICNPPEHLPAQPTSELLLFPFEVFRAPFMIYYYFYPRCGRYEREARHTSIATAVVDLYCARRVLRHTRARLTWQLRVA